MITPTDTKHIVRDPDVYGGKPCIEGHRISIHDIAVWHQQGQAPEAIAHDFGLTLGQVYAALSYYYDHQDEIDREIAQEVADVAARARADNSPLAQRIRAAIAARRGQQPHA
jgi:uncharacterized protein (DUF433 family)